MTRHDDESMVLTRRLSGGSQVESSGRCFFFFTTAVCCLCKRRPSSSFSFPLITIRCFFFPFLSFPFLSFPFLSFPFLSFPFLSIIDQIDRIVKKWISRLFNKSYTDEKRSTGTRMFMDLNVSVLLMDVSSYLWSCTEQNFSESTQTRWTMLENDF